MKKAVLPLLVVVAVGAFVLLGGASKQAAGTSYWIVLDNAFGLTNGGDVKVGGVKAGKIEKFGLTKDNRAKVQIQLTESGFKQFTNQATCNTRPQSVIGEYFIDCQPGKGKPLKSGGVVPVSRTTGTVPIDLVQNVLRLPYRQRLQLIIGELGAAAAGNGDNINAALRRAVPALRETDGLLRILGDESQTIKGLVRDADTVIGDLARNKRTVVRFVLSAKRTSQLTAERRADLQATFHKLPAFLTQLRPTMVSLGKTADNTSKTLATLKASSGQLKTFFADVPPFADASKPALRSLAKASVTGKRALTAARPTIHQLRKFSGKTPELGGNLAVTLKNLDDRKRAVENDPRAAVQLGKPGAKVGYTGLEALLMYVFNQSVAINAYDQNGHLLRVNGFVSPCSAYVDKATRDQKMKTIPGYKHCTSWIGPNQPGITAPDTSNKRLIQNGTVNPSDTSTGGSSNPSPLPGLPLRRGTKQGKAGKTAGTRGVSSSGRDLSGVVAEAMKNGGKSGGSTSNASSNSSNAQPLLDYLLSP
jgi:virulence factor Mce-like protein